MGSCVHKTKSISVMAHDHRRSPNSPRHNTRKSKLLLCFDRGPGLANTEGQKHKREKAPARSIQDEAKLTLVCCHFACNTLGS